MITLQLIKPPPLSTHSHDTIKTPLRLFVEDRSAANKIQVTGTENLPLAEKNEEVKKNSFNRVGKSSAIESLYQVSEV